MAISFSVCIKLPKLVQHDRVNAIVPPPENDDGFSVACTKILAKERRERERGEGEGRQRREQQNFLQVSNVMQDSANVRECKIIMKTMKTGR